MRAASGKRFLEVTGYHSGSVLKMQLAMKVQLLSNYELKGAFLGLRLASSGALLRFKHI